MMDKFLFAVFLASVLLVGQNLGYSILEEDDDSSSSVDEGLWTDESDESVSEEVDPEDYQFNDPEIVDYVNSLDTTWKAKANERFMRTTEKVMKGMLGVRQRFGGAREHNKEFSETRNFDMEIPKEFDSRQHWKECNSISLIRDQSSCGSCWAFGAVEAMSDRICIHSNGKEQVTLSADDLLSCCTSCGKGCDGGDPLEAWEYWTRSGIVTGSNYTANQGCRPYPFPPCEHHVNATHFKPCQHDLYPTPKCARKCKNPQMDYRSQLYYGDKAYPIENNVEAIQKEILTRGPIEVAFNVYADFTHYQSGVYRHVAGQSIGGHAVRMIGWGEEKGTPYWLIANSWNTDWGDKGLFKILRGSDECGIESECVAGVPRDSEQQQHQRRQHPRDNRTRNRSNRHSSP